MESPRLVPWFVAGIIILILLSSYAPKLAGGAVILLVAVFGLRAAQKGLI